MMTPQADDANPGARVFFPTDAEVRLANLETWWRRMFEADFDQMAPKLDEYTSADLEIMGMVMEQWGLSEDKLGAEAACMWYILGKVARAVAAYRQGRLPSVDTLHDIRVYAGMAQRIRETGRWP